MPPNFLGGVEPPFPSCQSPFGLMRGQYLALLTGLSSPPVNSIELVRLHQCLLATRQADLSHRCREGIDMLVLVGSFRELAPFLMYLPVSGFASPEFPSPLVRGVLIPGNQHPLACKQIAVAPSDGGSCVEDRLRLESNLGQVGCQPDALAEYATELPPPNNSIHDSGCDGVHLFTHQGLIKIRRIQLSVQANPPESAQSNSEQRRVNIRSSR